MAFASLNNTTTMKTTIKVINHFAPVGVDEIELSNGITIRVWNQTTPYRAPVFGVCRNIAVGRVEVGAELVEEAGTTSEHVIYIFS